MSHKIFTKGQPVILYYRGFPFVAKYVKWDSFEGNHLVETPTPNDRGTALHLVQFYATDKQLEPIERDIHVDQFARY